MIQVAAQLRPTVEAFVRLRASEAKDLRQPHALRAYEAFKACLSRACSVGPSGDREYQTAVRLYLELTGL